MKLHFDEITRSSRNFIREDGRWLADEGCSFSARYHLRRQDQETVLLEGEISGQRRWPCDRCGEEAVSGLHGTFVYLLTTRPEEIAAAESECSDEDAITLYLAEPVIDVEEILREQACLALPVKNLCRADCQGICAGCGAALNVEDCRCSPDLSRSPFSVLKKLTGNEKN